MSLREIITSALKNQPKFLRWEYGCEKELPADLSWMKVNAPNTSKIFRWDKYQICDIVMIDVEGFFEYGMIVDAFDDDEQVIQCVIAWIYTRQRAKSLSFHAWPRGARYLLSNHFQLIDSKCFVRRAPLEVRKALHGNHYREGIDFVSNKVVRFEETGNCIVRARTAMELLPFNYLPTELKDMVFRYLMDSEDSKDGIVKAEQTGPNSWQCWGYRNASKGFQIEYDGACQR
jgi:hypothetical protein